MWKIQRLSNSFNSDSLSGASDVSDVNTYVIIILPWLAVSSRPLSPGIMNYDFDCYYCDGCKTNTKDEYERHIITRHPGKLCYPGKADLERLDSCKK